ncbi:MAG: hypothetical protein AAFP84_18700, partial [Actinomycetota bacterium]
DLGPKVRETLGRCNMMKHVGTIANLADDERIEQAGAFVEAIDLLVQIPPSEFWAESLPIAESLAQEARDAVEIRVATAQAKAQERLRTVGDRLAELAARAEAEIEADADGDAGLFTAIECPVCASPARAFGDLVDNGDVEVDWNRDGTNYFWVAAPTTIVDRFQCDVCELILTGRDEIAASGVPSLIENDRVDPDVLAELSYDDF